MKTPSSTCAKTAHATLRENILEQLARLESHIETQNTHQQIHWGHVGDLDYISRQLKNATDVAFHEGEHAPETGK